MTLAERLRSLVWKVKQIDTESPYGAENAEKVCADIRALAAYVDGRVVAGVDTSEVLPDPRFPHIKWRCELRCRYEWGSTELDAIANQQQYADERDGRVMP